MRSVSYLFIVSALALTACGGAEDGSELSLDAVGEWSTLLAVDLTVAPGEEDSRCARLTLDDDVYVQAFEAISTATVEHATLTFGEPVAPDGVGGCGMMDARGTLIYSSSGNSAPLQLPKGVAVHVPAGSQLLLAVQLRGGAEEARGATEMRVKTIESSDVSDVAEALAVCPSETTIPVGVSTQEGHCTLQSDGFLFAAGPHLPQMGRHLSLVANSTFSGHVTLLDTDRDNGGVELELLERQVPMRAGETVAISCERENDSGELAREDTSGMHGMCYASIYRYPARSDGLLCNR